jgi:gliding motility-associated-like protein
MRVRLSVCFLRIALLLLALLDVQGLHAQWKMSSTIVPTLCDERGSLGGEVILDVSGVPGIYTYSWSSGGTAESELNLGAGYVSVDVRNGAGLDTTASFYVPQGTCDPGPAQVFTPNGDGIHDVWIIGNTAMYPNLLVLVYNRWGQLVYESKGKYEPWNGKSLIGQPLTEATYYFIIYEDAADRGKGIVQGTVTIMR